MKKIAIVGFGDLGEQFYAFLKNDNKNSFVFFDDFAFAKKKVNAFPFKEYASEKFSGYDFYVALGYHNLQNKIELINLLEKLKKNVPYFIHPTTFVNPSASVGVGSFVYPMCNIDKDVSIGKSVLINNSVCISHNSTIGDGCYISPGVVISGAVKIGERTFIGSGAIISNGIKIGKDVKIGIGTVVTKDIPDGCSVVGNPAKIVKDIKII